MSSLYLNETHISKNDDCIIGESGLVDSFFDTNDSKGYILDELKKEYGKVVSKVYIDKPVWNHFGYIENYVPEHIGYVFEKKMQYQDCKETYIHQVWVTLYNSNNCKDYKFL